MTYFDSWDPGSNASEMVMSRTEESIGAFLDGDSGVAMGGVRKDKRASCDDWKKSVVTCEEIEVLLPRISSLPRRKASISPDKRFDLSPHAQTDPVVWLATGLSVLLTAGRHRHRAGFMRGRGRPENERNESRAMEMGYTQFTLRKEGIVPRVYDEYC